MPDARPPQGTSGRTRMSTPTHALMTLTLSLRLEVCRPPLSPGRSRRRTACRGPAASSTRSATASCRARSSASPSRTRSRSRARARGLRRRSGPRGRAEETGVGRKHAAEQARRTEGLVCGQQLARARNGCIPHPRSAAGSTAGIADGSSTRPRSVTIHACEPRLSTATGRSAETTILAVCGNARS